VEVIGNQGNYVEWMGGVMCEKSHRKTLEREEMAQKVQ
jgi:hypothetical protein